MSKFITFEGIEASGKSTQSKRLYDYLVSSNKKAVLTREPGGTNISEQVREILINEKNTEILPKTELLLNFAGRLQHIEQLIKPALAENKFVISDRFFDSTYAYQGGGGGVDFDEIREIHHLSIGNFTPDITFLVDLDVEVAFSRISNRMDNNRYENLDLEFHQKVRASFLEIAKDNPRIKIIDGTQLEDEIFNQILRTLNLN